METAGSLAGILKELTPGKMWDSITVGREARKNARVRTAKKELGYVEEEKSDDNESKIAKLSKTQNEISQESTDEIVLAVIDAKDEIVDAIEAQLDAELAESRRLEREAKRDAKFGSSQKVPVPKTPTLVKGAGSGVSGKGPDTEGTTVSGIMESVLGSLGAVFATDVVKKALSATALKSVLKFLGKATLFGWLGVSLFQGIKEGWDTWLKTGDLSKSITAGLRETLSAMTFGLLSPEDIAKIDAKINETIKGMFDGIIGAIDTIKTRLGFNTDKESKIAALDAEKKGIISELNSVDILNDPGREESLHKRLKEIKKERDELTSTEQYVPEADGSDIPSMPTTHLMPMPASDMPDSTYKTPAGSKIDYARRRASDLPDSTHKTPAGSKIDYARRRAATMDDTNYKTSAGSKIDSRIIHRLLYGQSEAFGGDASIINDARSGEEYGGGDPSVVRDIGTNLGARMSDSNYKQVGGGAFKRIAKPLWEQDAEGKISIYLYDNASASNIRGSDGMSNLSNALSSQYSISKHLSTSSSTPVVVANTSDNRSSSVVNNNSFSTPAPVSTNYNDRLQSRFTTRSMA